MTFVSYPRHAVRDAVSTYRCIWLRLRRADCLISTSSYVMRRRKNHLLIVDEPESHLDTSNQILLARLLARCVRAGLKVLITTHSDYLIKEINNLIMLSRPFENKEAVVKKLKYSTDDFINPDSIRAYVAQDNSLTRCDVDKFGIDMPVFDETIDRINRVANDLASRMSDESEA